MTDQTKALKLALEAFDQLILVATYNRPSVYTLDESEKAATILREALSEQPAHQEPVAWMTQARCFVDVSEFPEEDAKFYGWKPLYTAPPAQCKPLTDEQQIAEALRTQGLTLVKTASGYKVLKLGQITAQGITGERK